MSKLRTRNLSLSGRLPHLQELRNFKMRINMRATDMYIQMKGIQLYAFHGVSPQETSVGANFHIDLSLKTNFSRAAQTDDLKDTVSYADVYQSIKEEMKIPSKLLEHVCERIAYRLFYDFPTVEEIDISLAKENPPMGACGISIGISAHYTR